MNLYRYRPLSISCDSKTENINVIAQTLSSSGDGAEKNVLLEIDVSQHTIKEVNFCPGNSSTQ